jgi:plasmid stability protein
MAEVLVRDLNDEALKALKRRAAGNGRSLQAEVKLILEQAAVPGLVDHVKLARKIRRLIGAGPHTDSAVLLREDRDR